MNKIIKRIILFAFPTLSISLGILSGSNVENEKALNANTENIHIKSAAVDPDSAIIENGYRVLYYMSDVYWGDSCSNQNYFYSRHGFSYKLENGNSFVTPLVYGTTTSAAYSEVVGSWVAKLYIPTNTKWIRFYSWTSKTSDNRYFTPDYQIMNDSGEMSSDQVFIANRDLYYHNTSSDR